MSALLTRWNALPRAARWMILLLLALGAYFGVVEPALDWRARAALRADALEAGLRRGAERAAQDAAATSAIALAASRFGQPLPPAGEERLRALNDRVESIFRSASVTGLTIRSRTPSTLARDTSAGLAPPGRQVQRIVLDIEFEAAPETAAEIIAALERAPEVAAVGRITMRRIDRDTSRRVAVSIAPEAWVIAQQGGRS